LVRFGVAASKTEDESLAYSLVDRPSPYMKAPWMQLVHRTGNQSSQWDAVMAQIARWLARHLDNPKRILWIADKGGRLDKTFEYFLTNALKNTCLNSSMEALWRIVLSDRLASRAGGHSLYSWGKRLKEIGLTPLLRMELRQLISPRVRLRKPYRWQEGSEADASGDESSVSELVAWEIVLASDFVHTALSSVSESDQWRGGLPYLLSDATTLLTDAMDLMRELGGASDTSDRSHWEQPSISEHPQNTDYRDWTALIELARDAWLAAAERAPAQAIREVHRWIDIPYPVFKRLVLFAAAQRGDLFSAQQAVDWLLSDNSQWLWSVQTQREAMRLVIALAPSLSLKQSERLQRALLQGPPPEMFIADATPETLQRVSNREVWLRLTAFKEAGGKLLPDAAGRLTALAKAYPQWEPAHERDEFPVWVGADGTWRRRTSAPKGRRELEVWLRENQDADHLHHEDDWRERCRTDFPRTVVALLHLAQDGEWIVDRWRQALQAWSEEDLRTRSWRCVSGPLARAPEDVVASLRHQISWWLNSCGKIVGPEAHDFFTLVERVLELQSDQGGENGRDLIFAAINHPVGLVTQAVLDWWVAQGLEDNQRLAESVATIFTRLCDLQTARFRYGRLLLCAHSITLFRVDHDWTAEYLLPQFDWECSADLAQWAWSGFLWSPRLYWPLLSAIKRPFLATAERYADLGELGDQYAAMLTFAALEQGQVFSNAELRKATSSLPTEGLARAAQAIVDGLEGAAERRAEYWRNRVKPYLQNIWPKSLQTKTGAVSENFSRLAIAAGEEFPDAVDTLRSWFQPSQDWDFSLHLLAQSDICARFPEDALAFLEQFH